MITFIGVLTNAMSRVWQNITHVRDRAGDERGAIIVIVAVFLTVCMGAGALAIDLGSGRQSQQKAQSGSDAAAEAGAASIPFPACSSADTTCINSVKHTATTVATENGACPTCVQVNYPYQGNYSRIQVVVSGADGGTLGPGLRVAAAAIASAQTSTTLSTSLSTGTSTSLNTSVSTATSTSLSTSTTVTTTPGTNTIPTSIFAQDATCGDNGLTISRSLSGSSSSPANNINLQAGTFSNGSLGIYYANGNFGSSIVYGSKCSFSHSSGGNYNGRTSTTATVYPYPDDYSKLTIPCDVTVTKYTQTGTDLNLDGGAGETICASQSATISATNNLQVNNITLVSPSISISAQNCNMTPDPTAPDNLELYAKSSTALTLNCPSNLNLNYGALFAPSAAINITALNFNTTAFIEGYQVHIALTDASANQGSLNLGGNGPPSGPGGPTTTTLTTTVTNTSTSTSTVTNTTTNTTTNTVTNTSTSADGSALSG